MERKTVEEWKELKFPPTKTLQEMIATRAWLFDSAKQLYRWPVGEEMTEEEFDKAISSAADHYVR